MFRIMEVVQLSCSFGNQAMVMPMELQDSLLCPKCGHSTWVEHDHKTILQRCTCGLARVIFQELDGGGSITNLPKSVGPTLPRSGSKLSKTLGALASLIEANTQTIADKLKQDSGYTASQMTVLQARGLVLRVTEKKGVAGGSTWRLTKKAHDVLLIINKETKWH